MFPKYFRAATNKLVRISEELQVEWMLIGAAAVSKWGFPRATQDVDFTIALDETQSITIDELMKQSGFEKLSGPEEIQPSGLRLSKYWLPGPSKQPEDGIGVDVFYTSTEWQHEAMGRKVTATVAKGWPDYWIASKEDLLLYKLLALRAKDVIDLEGLMERQYSNFDWHYIAFWAKELGVLAHVEDLISQYQVAKGLEEIWPWESE
jgi:hypothetical protein